MIAAIVQLLDVETSMRLVKLMGVGVTLIGDYDLDSNRMSPKLNEIERRK